MTHETTLGTRIEKVLNAWASAHHHCANGGTGHPDYHETQQEPDDSETSKKYLTRAKPKIDINIASAIESVDRALRNCKSPQWFVNYLHFKYPTVGRFVATKATEREPSDFIAQKGMHEITGNFFGEQIERSLRKLIRSTERAFYKRLVLELNNSIPLISTRCVR